MTVTPGSHIIRQGGPRVGLALEVEGYEIRDCIHVVTSEGVEQWWLARWPFTGNTIQNLVKHGVGALDIERCRVGTTVETWPASRNYGPGQKIPGGFGKVVKTGEAPAGRWPPNLVFLHAEGCKRVGEKKVHGTSIRASSPIIAVRTLVTHSEAKGHQTVGREQPVTGYSDEDGKETVPEYECVEGCPVATLDVMSGILTTGAMKADVQRGKLGGRGVYGSSDGSGVGQAVEASSGGASRFFPCFETRDELQAWFERLLSVDPV